MTPNAFGASHEKCMQYELLNIVSATFADDDVGTVEAVVRALLEENGPRLRQPSVSVSFVSHIQ